jgi:hypothetical protein
MTTKHEIQAEQDASAWLSTLPLEVRVNTVATEALHESWLTNSPKQVAVQFVDCVKQRTWESVAYMPAVESKREVKHYTPIQWMRECIGAEPDELFRVVCGELIPEESAAPAAVSLVRLMAEEEPETLRELTADYEVGTSTMLGWNNLIKRAGFGEALAELQEAVKGEPGGQSGNSNASKNDAPHRGASNPDPTLSTANRCPKDRKSRLIRTLVNLKTDPEACKAKGTTTEKVSAALTRLTRGLTSSVEAAKREAGLAEKKPNAGLGIRGNPVDVATRLIRTVGAAHAKAIADAILQQLSNG